MLFRFEDDGEHVFEMRAVHIPLDIIALDVTGRVVEVYENVQPGSTDSIRVTSRDVLEVAGGWARAHGDSIAPETFDWAAVINQTVNVLTHLTTTLTTNARIDQQAARARNRDAALVEEFKQRHEEILQRLDELDREVFPMTDEVMSALQHPAVWAGRKAAGLVGTAEDERFERGACHWRSPESAVVRRKAVDGVFKDVFARLTAAEAEIVRLKTPSTGPDFRS